MFCTGLHNIHHGDTEDQLDGSDFHSPRITSDEAFHETSDGYESTAENGATSAADNEAIAAEYLRVIGDRLQLEFGNQLDAMMNDLDWTLAREALLLSAGRLLADFVAKFSDMWTRVSKLSSFTVMTWTSLKRLKQLNDIALLNKSSHSYGVSLAV